MDFTKIFRTFTIFSTFANNKIIDYSVNLKRKV